MAAALHAFAQVLDRTGLVHAGLTAVIDHLWRWPSVRPETFNAWYDFDSPTLRTALGDELRADVEQESRHVGVDPVDLRLLLEHTAEIVYHALFTVTGDAESLAHLATVEEIASHYMA